MVNTPSFGNRMVLGAGLVLAGAIFSSSKAVIIKLAYAFDINAVSLLSLRMLYSFPVFLVIGIWAYLRYRPGLSDKEWGQLILVGLLGYYLAALFDFIGLQYITAGLERLIVFAYPTLVLLITRIIWNRSITQIQWAALILTYLGIFLAMFGDIEIPDPTALYLGAFWVFLCAFAYALHLIGSEFLLPKMGVAVFSSWAMVFASIGVFVHAWFNAETVQIFNHPKEVYQLAGLLAVITTVLPPYLMSAGISRLGVGNAAILGSVGPVSTLILAWWFLDESLSPLQMAGASVVMIGVFIIGAQKRRQASSAEKKKFGTD